MLRPLLDGDFPVAASLLNEGFPSLSESFWLAGLKIVRARCSNASLGLPVGWLMMDGEQAVAVALAPASVRLAADGQQQTLVNVASWYVRPQFRWRAALMLRAMLSDPNVVYIDVTPTPDVARMLTLMGFRAINVGVVVACTAVHAWRSAPGVRVRELRPDDALPPYSPPRDQIEAHRELGCVPLLVEDGRQATLLIYRSKRMRGVPVARLKYIGSHVALNRHMGAVARLLLIKGFAFLSWDRRSTTPHSPFNVLRSGGIWYARGGNFEDRTDFIGTELSLLNF
jgi:hypothetical protein